MAAQKSGIVTEFILTQRELSAQKAKAKGTSCRFVCIDFVTLMRFDHEAKEEAKNKERAAKEKANKPGTSRTER